MVEVSAFENLWQSEPTYMLDLMITCSVKANYLWQSPIGFTVILPKKSDNSSWKSFRN